MNNSHANYLVCVFVGFWREILNIIFAAFILHFTISSCATFFQWQYRRFELFELAELYESLF